MKNLIKRTGAFCCALALLTLLCWPCMASATVANGRDNNLMPDGDMPNGIEYPMRRAVREGSEALDDMMPNREDGTVNDRTQGASDGVLDGTDGAAGENGQGNASDSGSASGSEASGTTDTNGKKEGGMTTAAIVIACLAAIAIIVLIFIAIPKSKSKPGGTGNKN